MTVTSSARAQRKADRLRQRLISRLSAELHNQLNDYIAERTDAILNAALQGCGLRIEIAVLMPIPDDVDQLIATAEPIPT